MKFSFFVLFSLISYSIAETDSDVVNTDDLPSIVVSMSSYNVSNTDGESIESFHQLSSQSFKQIILKDIPSNVHFVVVQAHSHLANVTLSYDKKPQPSTSVTGTNVGLVKVNYNEEIFFYLMCSSCANETKVLIAVQAYDNKAPVPGGCNMEFPVEVSPFLIVNHTDDFEEVDFAPASAPLILNNALLPLNNECKLNESQLIHEMYYLNFPENDFTNETYFKMLKSLMTISQIKKNAVLAKHKLSSPPLQRIFASYPGTGKAFVVVSHFQGHSSVYVPSFTYGCYGFDECSTLFTEKFKVICVALLIIGLFICFFGHYFFRIEVFFFGLLSTTLVTYILVESFIGNSMSLSISVAIGFFLASLTLLLCGLFEVPIMSLILVSLTAGFLLASVFFYPFLDLFDIFSSNTNYWGTFGGIMLAFSLVLIPFAGTGNIVACSFVGSYLIVASIENYVKSNIKYIIINTVRRATVKKFRMALIAPPFELKDALLCLTWAGLVILGIAVQRFLMNFTESYPTPRNYFTIIVKKLSLFKRNSSFMVGDENSERRSLLFN